jgi:hypothetical protein
MRLTDEAAYENMAMRHRLGRLPDWEPVPERVEQGLLAIRIGQRLGIPAPAVETLDGEWIDYALLSMEVERRLDEKRAKARKDR